jgi:hypothetical protein
MRFSEGMILGFFAAFALAGFLVELDPGRRLRIAGIGLPGAAVAGSLGTLSPHPVPPLLRDLLPGLLPLMAYWQAGQFFTGGDPALQATLRAFDERWLRGMLRLATELPGRPAPGAYLELAYLS